MEIQNRIITFVRRSNWILFAVLTGVGFLFFPVKFGLGVLFGGIIVTLNFHLLARTLKKAFTPPHLTSANVILAKYYLRFLVSGVIIFILIKEHIVNPLGLFVGLSVVVASLMLATVFELKRVICKEAI